MLEWISFLEQCVLLYFLDVLFFQIFSVVADMLFFYIFFLKPKIGRKEKSKLLAV